jgi:hypothetical protein
MNPKRKLRLILLVGMVPFASLLLYVVRSHHLPKWFPFVEFGYFVAFLIYMTLYVRRHPELRSYPTEKAMGVNVRFRHGAYVDIDFPHGRDCRCHVHPSPARPSSPWLGTRCHAKPRAHKRSPRCRLGWSRYLRRWIRPYGPGLVPHKESSELEQQRPVLK